MAIALFCYSTYSIDELACHIGALAVGNESLFLDKFIISRPRSIDEIDLEIARENGLTARSNCLISLNDKRAAALIPTVAALVKATLGEKNVVVLFEGEKLM